MERLEEELASDGLKATEAFWREIDQAGTPLIERVSGRSDRIWVTFLWRQTPQRDPADVGVVGIFNRTPWQSHDALTRLAKSDVWYRTYELESDARAPYALSWPAGRVTDEKPMWREFRGGAPREIFRDPRARKQLPEVFFSREIAKNRNSGNDSNERKRNSASDNSNNHHGSNGNDNSNSNSNSNSRDSDGDDHDHRDSGRVAEPYFEGPDATPERWLAPRENIPHGNVIEREITSNILNNTRRVAIYTPPGHSGRSEPRNHADNPAKDKPGEPYPFVIFFDGQSYLHSAAVPTLLDNMRADGVLPPMVAIMIDYIDAPHRQRELSGEPEFGRFLVEELLPGLRDELHLTRDPRQTIVAGASRGGLAASYIALRHSDTFGNVLAQSGSFSWAPKGQPDGAFARALAAEPALPLRFYLVAGTWESPERMLRYSRALRDLLQEQRYEVTYSEFSGGHTFLNWRATLPEGLITLMASRR